jgi:MFS family permease
MAANALPRRARTAVTAVFFVNGAVFSSLFARLPAIKSDLGLDDGELGVALLFATVGLLIAQVTAGALAVRYGSRAVMRGVAPAYCAAVALPALAPTGEAFALGLFVLGGANGALDVAMNVQGAAVESRYGRPLMSSLHAAFSFGALTGAGAGALLAAGDVPPDVHLVGVAILTAVAVVVATRGLLAPEPLDRRRAAPMLARPSRRLAALGALAFCVLLAEGSVADWSAIYLRESIGSSQAIAAVGLAAFSLTMGVGRLAGDRIAVAIGPSMLAGAGALLAAAGLGAALAVQRPGAAIAGFAAMGLGLAAVFPLVVSAAANRPDVAPGPAIAAVSTTGYAGFMVGPPLIGLLAELGTLRGALLLPGLLCLLAATLSRAVQRAPARAGTG